MKFFSFIVHFLVSISLYPQNGVVTKDTLLLNNGLKFIKGSMVSIGKGSRPDGGYSHIFTEPVIHKKRVISMPIQLTSGWSGYRMKIVDFKTEGNDITGKKYYLILSTGNKLNYMCDPELAVDAKELL